MLRNTFCFLPGIGPKTEKKLWKNGIKEWNDFIGKEVPGVKKRKQEHDNTLRTFREAALKGDSKLLGKKIPPWRLWEEFKDEACYLDIETHGEYGNVTVIGMYNGQTTKTLVKGVNLTRKAFLEEIRKHKILVTFNGKAFDIPVLEKYFGWKCEVPNIDLMHVCRKLGMTGGLKKIEKEMGIKRCHEVANVVGADAPVLWDWWHATGDKYYLELLVKYNEEDIINLEPIAKKTIKQLWDYQSSS